MKMPRKSLKQKNLDQNNLKKLSTDTLRLVEGGNERFPDVPDPAAP